MTTIRQKKAAKKNIKKAQAAWRRMSQREHSLSQPEGRKRKRPGATGKGEFFHVEVRPKEEFVTFRTQDVGHKGHIERRAGKRSSGSWSTQSWLIGKKDAHRQGKTLVADSPQAKKLLSTFRDRPKWVKGDIFEAKDRPNVPERTKPTRNQRRAQASNIKKAQAARWK